MTHEIKEIPVTDLVEQKITKSSTSKSSKKEDKGPSKSQTARDLVQANFNNVANGTAVTRTEVIKQIMQTCGMKEAGASTYYQNAVMAIRKDMPAGQDLPRLPLGTSGKK